MTYGKSNKRLFIEKYFDGESEIPYLDNLTDELSLAIEKDETPTTPTGWMWEESGELKKKMQQLADKYYNLYQSDNDTCLHNEYDICYFAMQELSSWLTSHTAAPKAEDWTIEETALLAEIIEVLQLHNEHKLAGHLESLRKPKAEEPHRSAEEILFEHTAVEWSFDKENKRAIYSDPAIITAMKEYANQFKQSPSIKRPTVDQIKEAAHKEWDENHPSERRAFIGAINWFLSLQSDK